MSKRVVYILLGAVAFLVVLGAGAVAGGALTYYFTQARPAQAALDIRFPAAETEDGVLVAGVEADSPAEKAGVKRGDILTEIDAKRLPSQPSCTKSSKTWKPARRSA